MENRSLGIKGKPGFYGAQVAKMDLGGPLPGLPGFPAAFPEGREVPGHRGLSRFLGKSRGVGQDPHPGVPQLARNSHLGMRGKEPTRGE